MKKVLIGFLMVAVLALACGEEEGVTPTEPERLEPTSPVNVLKNVEISFNERDINLLKAMLSTNFVFYFDPRDVGQNPPGSHYEIPESWSYTEFWQVARNMFRRAYSIDLSITTSGVGTPGENETTYKAENVNISLLVMISELSGYIADSGYCNFAFERYDSASGKKYWRLTGWWDRSSEFFDAYPGVTPTSIGKILALLQ
jgi:hypothetical protein